MRIVVLMLVIAVTAAGSPALTFADCCCPDLCCCAEQGSGHVELETVVFHLPMAFNDGAPVPEAQLEALLADVVEIAGGFTYHEATGGWMFEGRLYRDPVWVVKVGLRDEQVDLFEQLVETRLKGEFGQLALWVEEAGSASIL